MIVVAAVITIAEAMVLLFFMGTASLIITIYIIAKITENVN